MKWFSLVVVFLSPVAFADDLERLDWLLDLEVDYQQQSIEKSTAELSSLTLSPSLEWENLDFSLTIPWYDKRGEFYINGVRPHLITRCERLLSLKPMRQKVLIESGKITQKFLDKCETVLDTLSQLNTAQSGLGDITGFARYHFLTGADTGWSANLGLGYKSNTGDSNSGLGSGTQDLLFEMGVLFSRERFSFSLNAGYDVMNNEDSIKDVYQSKNFAYFSVNVSQGVARWLRLGASFNSQEAYVEQGNSTNILTSYVDIMPYDPINIHAYFSHYSGDVLLPDNEVGINLTYSF